MLFGIDVSIIGLIVDILGFLATILIFIITFRDSRKATEEQTRRECVRATLSEFADLRRTHQDFEKNMTPDNRSDILKAYLSDLERFAVGCNRKAYDIEVVNQMSGGMLVTQYKRYFRGFISERRRNAKLNSNVMPWKMYIEYETMIRDIFRMRNVTWEDTEMSSEEQAVLDIFMRMDVSTSEDVFALFRSIPGAIEKHGEEAKQGFLYIPGTRKDRCLLVAHADTYFDLSYNEDRLVGKPEFKAGIYYSATETCGIGADDRAGCAMLWLLRNSGHSLLIVDGEEHGQIGSKFIRDFHPDIFEELNNHTFMLQLDRRGNHDYKYYKLKVSKDFVRFIDDSTGYSLSESSGRTDICTLCTKICGVNLSVGYYDEHTPQERLVYDEWLKTFNIVKQMLDRPLKAYPLLASE